MKSEKENTAGQAAPGIWQILRSGRLLLPLLVLIGGVVIGSAVSLFGLYNQGLDKTGIYLLALAGGMVLFGLAAFLLQMKRQLLAPLVALETSVAQVSQGDPGAELPSGDTGVFSGMVQDIDSINKELMDLYEDMDSRVAQHTTRLAQKTASLKILYDVAATINRVEDLDELLVRFLRVLKEMVNGLAISAKVVQLGGCMRLVGAIGLDDRLQREAELLPLELCPCGVALSPGDVCCRHDAQYCIKQLGRKMYTAQEVEQISVPLEYHGDVLGQYDIYVQRPGVSEREDILELLETVGSHLGMAVAKQRSDENARRLSIYKERNALAHELHDSLAQTLASLRFQIRMMEDSLQQEQGRQLVAGDLERIRNGVDEAHTELRELLNSFRASMDGRDLNTALEKLVQRFSLETGVATYYQQECVQPKLSSTEEMQILRIVQESLANIRKHAKAHTVRVLLTCRAGSYVLLVEDDGVGFEGKAREGHPGEHIGLSIMEERARRLGGQLRIESEVGEGTRVELTYAPKVRSREIDRKWTS
ncbi:ATP-binding protein [Thiolapillus sp.]